MTSGFSASTKSTNSTSTRYTRKTLNRLTTGGRNNIGYSYYPSSFNAICSFLSTAQKQKSKFLWNGKWWIIKRLALFLFLFCTTYRHKICNILLVAPHYHYNRIRACFAGQLLCFENHAPRPFTPITDHHNHHHRNNNDNNGVSAVP